MKKIFLVFVVSFVVGQIFCQTTNYLPKYTSTSTFGNSTIYQSSTGNIGIGTTSPSAKLEVRKDVSSSTQITLLNIINKNSGDQDANMKANIDFWLWDSNTHGTSMSYPQARIGIVGSSVATQSEEAAGRLCFYTANATYPTNTLTERMRITPEGFVGIGTQTPGNNLEVYSVSRDIASFRNSEGGADIVIYGGISSGMIRNTAPGKDLEFGTFTSSNSFNDNQLWLGNNGSIGIGTSDPTSHFNIDNGTLKISGGNSDGNTARFIVDAEGSYNHRFLEFRNTNGVQMIVDGSGRLYAKEIQVTLSSPLGDFVFDDDYSLLTISELESFIDINSHLPGVPSAKEVKENGLNLGEMDNILLQKIEELTLYTIEQQKLIDELRDEINSLKEE